MLKEASDIITRLCFNIKRNIVLFDHANRTTRHMAYDKMMHE